MHSSDQFYTQFAKSYAQYASTKQPYLFAVNNFIKKETGTTETMIDIGSGDGKRSKKISELLNIKNITLVDNSEGMIDLAKNILGVLIIKTDISSTEFKPDKKYDLVLCLWNVLGHITVDKRVVALKNIASLVNENGIIFLDINNRYNVANYGTKSVIINIIKDIFNPKKSNGDFDLKINIDGSRLNTTVHIFNPFEIENLLKSVGLSILKRQIIDYKTGKTKNYFWQGQLAYKLKKI